MQGKLIIFTAPSGAGKTTIVRRLIAVDKRLEFSVSACTRARRSDEVHGKDYYFLSPEEFQQKIANNEFIEWEEVYKNHFYGTLKSEVERIWSNGKHVVFDVDVQGALKIKQAYEERALGIFVKPPSTSILFQRLTERATENAKSLAARINKAKSELEFEDKFDAVIVNDKLDDAVNQAEELINRLLSENKDNFLNLATNKKSLDYGN